MSDEMPLTVAQVCKVLPGARGAERVSPSTVARWIASGVPSRAGVRVRLAAVRAGGRWLIRRTDLDQFFEKLAASNPDTLPATQPAPAPKARARTADTLKKLDAELAAK